MTNNIYEKNVTQIKNLNPYLYNEISRLELKTVKCITTKNHSKNVIKTVSGIDFIVHSQYNPQFQAQFIAENVFADNPDIIFLFGLGLGYELKEMIKLNKNVRYFIIEPDEEIFKILLQSSDIKFLFDNINVHFILGKKADDIGSFYENVIGCEKSVKAKFIILPSYKNIYRDLIHNVFLNIREKINNVKVNITTLTVSHRQWFQNYIGNLKYLNSMCPVTNLKENFKEKPVIIVSAGPSLNHNIETLKKLQGKVLIAAAGSGISVLESNGIKADIMCLIDGWEAESKLIENVEINKNTSLFYSSMLYYKINDKLPGAKFLLNVNQMDKKIYDTVGEIPFNLFSGPSVANSLAYNLSGLGCNPIIFLGQDLCYSSGKNYAKGAVYEKDMSRELNTQNYIKLRNKNNEDVYTTSPFLAMKSSMEFCIKVHPNIEYLNGTKDGLCIEGTKDIDFNEYADKNFTDKYDMNLEKIYYKFINNKKNIKNLQHITENLENENLELIRLCKNAIEYIESETNKEKNRKYIKNIYEQLDKISLYKEILNPNLTNLDYIYKNKSYIEKNKQKLEYILDKCFIMDNAFTYIVKGGKQVGK
ncbi:motility associated factor glycosyltransferase family protein [Clostridium tyrobutyricum]|uniref:motility associated factor glycosyltransferase family protein n=1 Tax=Clostridium tyrobutyricum TaxID=1519 RepID=UPI001C395581|nr:6-hydroxymethylpterin diphosphokinase MptE-like protein [Clostridium tyrobutyricum]MBV4416556.1 DUF115 domain-containing protein [Clostridium tyrobutyricum]